MALADALDLQVFSRVVPLLRDRHPFLNGYLFRPAFCSFFIVLLVREGLFFDYCRARVYCKADVSSSFRGARKGGVRS